MLKHSCTFEETRRGDVLIFRLYGEIDHHSATQIRVKMDERILMEQPGKVILDLSAIEFMDSSGLGLIMGRYAVMQKLGGELSLLNPHRRIVQILEMAGLSRMVRIEEEKEEQ